MKSIVFLMSAMLFSNVLFSQINTKDKLAVETACLNYIEGFYEGDTLKLQQAITAELYKHGYWRDENGKYQSQGLMSYEKAINYAEKVHDTGRFVASSAPKEVKVLDIGNHIACVKITAWWGIDYMLLSRAENDGWIIEQVLWEGPLEK